MKLSEAIRLGSMLGPQLYNGGTNNYGGRCVIKSAALAMGRIHCSTSEAEALWPWVRRTRSRCPECQTSLSVGNVMILHLNDWHKWTRERIADWVATVEPQDIQNEQTDGGEGTRTELSRSDEVQNIAPLNATES